MISQNDMEYLQDMVERAEMSADEANVEKVLTQRVLVVKPLPKSVRAALNIELREKYLLRWSGVLPHRRERYEQISKRLLGQELPALSHC